MLRTAPNLSDATALGRTNTDSDGLSHARLAGPTEPMVQIPVEDFRHRLVTQMVKHVRPPTRKDLGKKVRKLRLEHVNVKIAS